jgi:hypothetical protein
VNEESSFSEEKEAKRLFPFGARQPKTASRLRKSFLLLFYKKEESPFLASRLTPRRPWSTLRPSPQESNVTAADIHA